MLAKLIHLLEESGGQIDVLALSQHLHVQPAAVSGMIETLLQMGRLAAIHPACKDCRACGFKDRCGAPAGPSTRFRLVSRKAQSYPG